jgi:hypothetical protein
MKTFFTKISFIVIPLCIILVSCQTKEERLHKKFEAIIKDYVSKDLKKGEKIDSIKILDVDTLSDYHFIKDILEPLLNSRIDELSLTLERLPDSDNIENLQVRQKYEREINLLIDKLQYYQTQRVDAHLDTKNLKFYLVNVVITTSNSTKISKKDYYAFPITPDFHIRELNELLSE